MGKPYAHDSPDPEVYRRAARILDSGPNEFACFVILQSYKSLYQEPAGRRDLWRYEETMLQYVDQFERMFSPETDLERIMHPYWLRYSTRNEGPVVERWKEARIYSLLLMADVCEQGF